MASPLASGLVTPIMPPVTPQRAPRYPLWCPAHDLVLPCDGALPASLIHQWQVTKPETLVPAMAGATTVVITTGPAYHCLVPSIYVGCKYYPGADPETMSWEAVKNQVAAFANNTGGKERHVVLVSNDLTTTPGVPCPMPINLSS